ncbi:maleylpyruvate isomerase N-terminal domain-containing protein [Actinoplanes sp. NPDC024001]|uniref:maleylpyruvate isomerase N-terminal domain-containing protein n=1 Tax=Actinoplanes sp. NPDC024001 TaxID=3154598 RepID=UPI0033C4D2A1
MIALRDEAAAFLAALGQLSAGEWDRPTRCTPWRVRDVVGHVITVLSRVPQMTGAPAPARADTTATSYYRADQRFSEAANADRVRTAQERPATRDEFAAVVGEVLAACEREPAGRIVRTRHGDAMLLTDFLTTRVVELAVHGLDVADAVGREPWLTPAAASELQRLLFGPDWPAAVGALGWDAVTLLRKTTGRAPVTADETDRLSGLGLRPLTLG